jgi:leucyl aminopeptidase
MQVRVESGDIAAFESPCIVVNLFEGVTSPAGATGAVDRALAGSLTELIASGDVRGKEGELTLIHTFGKLKAPRVVVAGLGKSADFSIDKVRDLGASLARFMRGRRIGSFATIAHGAGIGGLDGEACAQALAEGAVLGLYRFDRHKKRSDDAFDIDSMTIVERDAGKAKPLAAATERGVILAEATNFARDLANEPGNLLTPTEFAARAEAMAGEHGLGCKIFDREQAQEMGMNAFLAIARGSEQPPKFIMLTYQGAPDTAGDAAPLGLLGKGITFDTGGISIKTNEGMQEMKGDMSGGGAVVAAMMAIARLQPKINVTAMVPATENMPGGNAIKPTDVVRAMNGKSIEIANTDAEGRVVLSDALSYAVQLGLSPIVDVATLTGAMSIALGNIAYGIFSNSDALVDRIKSAGAASGEKCWELPMFPEYRELNKSQVADVKNSGARGAGSIAAAFFLKEFVDDRPWAHLDIAGVDFSDAEKGVYTKGSTGIPVRTLVNLTLDLAARPLSQV